LLYHVTSGKLVFPLKKRGSLFSENLNVSRFASREALARTIDRVFCGRTGTT